MPAEDDPLAEISRMANVLADRALTAQATGRSVPEAEIRALREAFILLKEQGKDPPALVSYIVRNITRTKGTDTPDEAE